MTRRDWLLGLGAAAALRGADPLAAANGPTPEFAALRAELDDRAKGWKALFNGKNLDGWRPQDYGRRATKPFDWRVPVLVGVDPADETKLVGAPFTGQAGTLPAALANREGKSANLVSVEEFADAEVYVEFAIPRKTNGGVCLMGNYEIQLYDSFGKPDEALTVSDNGAIYAYAGKRGRFGGAAPRTNASRPPGAWQSLRIRFRAPRYGPDGKKIVNARFLEVALNGVRLHGDYELIQSTRGSAPWPERERAPLLLQGDHGPIAYRNVWIRDLPESEAAAG